MANILYISYDGMTDALGQSQVIPYLLGLAALGHQIHILSTEKEAVYNQKKTQIEQLLAHKITWSYVLYTKKPPLLSTVKDIFSLWQKAKKIHQEKTIDIVHCRSYIAALIGLRMQKTYGTKFLFDMRGFWADERIDGNIWQINHPVFKHVYRFFKQKEIAFLNHADATISLTHNAKNKILHFPDVAITPDKISVIPCCVDIDRFDSQNINEENKNAIKKALGFHDDVWILTYLGSIGTWYMLDEMLAFFKVLNLNKVNAKMLFLTNEPAEDIYKKAREHNIPAEKIVIKNVDYTEVPHYLSIAHFAIFFILPKFSKSASSPIKQGEIMSMGIPIICNSGVGDTDYVIEKYDCGILVHAFNDAEYLNAIKKLEQKHFDTEKIRNAAIDFYALKKGITLYNNVYNKLLAL